MSQIQLSKTQPAVFSWSPDDLSVLQNLSKLSIGTIFQEIPKGREEATLKLLSDYDVYLLCGDPMMDLNEMHAALKRGKQGFSGVIFDIEPYGREEWKPDGDNSKILADFAEQVQRAYQYAKARDIEMLLCIPFWYDDTGYSDELELLVKNSDGICVMNYWRGKEWEHMEYEYELAGKYYKKLWSAYEFTKSDGKGILDQNTYAQNGINDALENFKNHFGHTQISPAFHQQDLRYF